MAQIERLFDEAAGGRGGALVLRGEAGVGKTALLEQGLAAAGQFQALRATGVESETELPFAGLHELVSPIVGLAETLPDAQARAIRAALALEVAPEPHDRLATYAATLSLLVAAAAEQPLLCIVDDAHWLDGASAAALAFAARRLEHDPVAVVFAVRDPHLSLFTAHGLPELRMEGLTDAEARQLVLGATTALLPAEVDRIVADARGNPLAVLEFEIGRAHV